MSDTTFQFKQFSVSQQFSAMKVGTDSDLLGALSVGGRRILDVGTGTGVLSLMLAQRYPEAQITAIEIDEDAVKDAALNFANAPFAERITLQHVAFQDYIQNPPTMLFDSVVCNPPYFDKSLECPDLGRTRARHSSSLPFFVLIKGAYDLLTEDGFFSVCIPLEVLADFTQECLVRGFNVHGIFRIKTVPRKEPKRFVVVFRKGIVPQPFEETACMRNADGTRSDWYFHLMKDFHLDGHFK